MSVSALHTLYAVNVATKTAANNALISQVEEFSIDPRLQEALKSSDGQVDPTYVAVIAQDPRLMFRTSKLATFLALSSSGIFTGGIPIDADGSHVGLQAWFQKLAEGGTRSAGSTHLLMTVKKGLLLPRALRASQNDAGIELEVVTVWDGTNAPVIIQNNQALTGSPSYSEMFVAGPATINGSTLSGVTDLVIDPGLREIVKASDGQVYPTYAAIESRQPMIEITTLDTTILSTYGLSGTAISSSTKFYLRKVAEGATRVADATAEHISFTVTEGLIYARELRTPQGQVVGARLMVRPTYDGVNGIVVVNAATAIT